MLGGAFRALDHNFTIGRGPEILGNYSRMGMKIIKNMKFPWGKNQNFPEIFDFLHVVCGEIIINIYICYNGGAPTEA